MVRSFLQECITNDISVRFDMDSLQRVSDAHVTSTFTERYNDVLWRVKMRHEQDGADVEQWCYLYLMLEFQSTVDTWMAVRILEYTALLWRELIHQGVIKKHDCLPPVLPIVIYSGNGVWTAKTDIAQLMAKNLGRLQQYQPQQSYFVLDERGYEAKHHEGNARLQGLATLFLRLERAKDARIAMTLWKEIVKALSSAQNLQLTMLFKEYVHRVMEAHRARMPKDAHRDTEEDFSMLSENIGYMIQQSHIEGMELGKLEGMELGKLEGMELGKLEGMEQGETRGKAEGLRTSLLYLSQARWGLCHTHIHDKLAHISALQDLETLIKDFFSFASLHDFDYAVDNIIAQQKTASCT